MPIYHSSIRLLTDTGLTDTDKAYFGGASAAGWLQSKTLQAFTNCTYQRTEGRLWARLGINYEKALFADYILYQNLDVSSEWLAGKITAKRYISLEVTEFDFELDAFMTFQHKIVWRDCLIEREHEAIDWNGSAPSYLNQAPEPFSPPYMMDYEVKEHYQDDRYIYLAVSCRADSDYDPIRGTHKDAVNGEMLSGSYSGLHFRECPTVDMANAVIAEYAAHGNINGIAQVFTSAVRKSDNLLESAEVKLPTGFLENWGGGSVYVPRNAKCLQYPFTKIDISNHNGTTNEYVFEKCHAGIFNYNIRATFGIKPVITLLPHAYGGDFVDNYDESITAEAGVLSSWAADVAADMFGRTWGSANPALYAGMALGGTAITALSMIGKPTPAKAASIAGDFTDVVSNLYNQGQNPPVARSANAPTSTTFNFDKVGFRVVVKTAAANYMRMVDDFFHKYGYASGRLKRPNLNSRPNWNYVKTAGAAITGNFAGEYQRQIISMFNSGVTLWKNGVNIGDYSPDNKG